MNVNYKSGFGKMTMLKKNKDKHVVAFLIPCEIKENLKFSLVNIRFGVIRKHRVCFIYRLI